MFDPEIKSLLDDAVQRINRPQFIEADPVQFPRLYTATPDIEIAALIAATIAWGRRPMILRNASRILSLMGHQPAKFTLEGAYEELPDELNLHRTFFTRHLKQMLRGLRPIYKKYGTLDRFVSECGLNSDGDAPWRISAAVRAIMADENGGEIAPGIFSGDTSALKRLNMALRWLVRNDGIIDLGIWKSLTPDRLFIPLDVHVQRTARELGLLTRRSNDRKAAVQLTQALREMRPDDPVIYDFALFGLSNPEALRTEEQRQQPG